MFKTYIITAIRFFANKWVVTLINIMGLAIGITCALLIFLFIQYELSVDQFHNKIDKLYRLLIVGESRDIDHVLEYRSDIIQERVRFLHKYPEITNFIRLLPWQGIIEHKKRWIRESRFWFADPHIFDMLTLPLKRGNPKTVLQVPNSVVITPAMADKYFGKEDPIGKTLTMHMSLYPALYTFTVTGILESLPKASSIKIDFLAYIPFEKLTQDRREIAGDTRQYVEVLTLVELVDPAVYQSLQEKVSDFYCHDVDKSMSLENIKYQLEPFKNAYLKSKATFWVSDFIPYFEDALMRKSDKRLFITLAVLGGIILVVSCINIINLATSQATLRAKEIGTRKVVGELRRQLIIQFITEIVLMSYLALLLALVLTELLLPSFNTLIKRELSINYINNGVFLLGVVGIATLFGILSGIYPTFVLSSLKPVAALKSLRLQSSTLIRKGQVITQIGMCVTFIIFSLVMLDEMNVLKVKDIGFNSENLIFFRVDDKDLAKRYPAFKKEILRIPGVTNMTASNFVPWKYGFMLTYAFYDDDARVRAQTMFADSSFIETYQIPVVDGEGFSTKRAEMPGYVIINEAARKVLQSTGTDPLFKVIDIPVSNTFWQHQILGIIQDYYYFYPSKRIKPLAILPSYHVRFVRNFVTIRLADGNHTDILAKIAKTVKRFFPKSPFEYKYVAKEMEKMHAQKLGYHWMALIFITGFALFIAAGGLFGFATYEYERCAKEIGIRKALGAKPIQIAMHFVLRFCKLTLIANVIAWPICYFIIQRILRTIDYPHPIQISLTYFLLAGLLTLVLTIVTVWYPTYRAALVDAAKALRYELKD
jgi:putative ABC transport system permease protein